MGDEYDLSRFLTAQDELYETALRELVQGEKESCWMWFVFPQLKGLGRSSTSKFYGIADASEALAYYEHPVLGARLIECCEAILEHEDKSALEIFGGIDCQKLRSCATLFERCTGDFIFYQVLEQFFDSRRDELTLRLLGEA